MEHNHVLLSALSVGVGLGAGLGLSSGLGAGGKRESGEDELYGKQIEEELLRQVIDGKECKETFQEFPYYLSEKTRELLTSAASVRLRQLHFSRHTRNLSPASREILLSGPAEFYLQTLAKALAHRFESKLLLLDVPEFSFKLQSKYGFARKESVSSKMSLSEVASERVSGLLGSLSVLSSNGKTKGTFQKHSNATGSPNVTSKLNGDTASQSAPANSAPLKHKSSLCVDEKLLMQLLFKVLVSVSEESSIILYIRDVDKILLQSEELYNLFHEMLGELPGPVLILGSKISDKIKKPGNLPPWMVSPRKAEKSPKVDERLAALFPYSIKIKAPEDEDDLKDWKAQLEENKKTIKSQDNRKHIAEILAANDVVCKDLNAINHEDTKLLSRNIEEIAISAISYYLMNTKDPEYQNGKLVISSESLSYGLDLFRKKKVSGDEKKKETSGGKKEVRPDNPNERHIRSELIPANEIGVTFEDIGALDDIKESLQELVMLPLRRPELFKSGLLKPCRGILLFGPPGTGKTMLAKAIANEAGASFINVSMSTITSMWFGEGEKNVRALFSVAAKVSPTIIFIDEVDSLLGRRARCGEHEATRRIKNEFMTHWDGLLTKQNERILVLAATNRPFDLDDAIIRRFERRIMVGLPSVETREIILKTLLAKENTENLDYKEIAVMTEGYTGSDLKNLCTAAAYRPVRELIKQEKLKDMEKNKKEAEGQSSEVASSPKKEKGKNKKDTKGQSSQDASSPKEDSEEQDKNKKDTKGQSSQAASSPKEDPEEHDKDKKDAKAKSSKVASSDEEDNEESVITLRPINMDDMIQAKKQVPASFDAHGLIMQELKQWNELYGERVSL